MNSTVQNKNRVTKAATFFAVCIILTLAYSNSFTASWHYDDFHHITENPSVSDLSNIPHFFSDSETFSKIPGYKMYRPLLMVTNTLNYALGETVTGDGTDVFLFHLVNFLFHLITVLAIFFIIRYLFRFRILIKGLNPTLPALFASLLFGLNTINTETIV